MSIGKNIAKYRKSAKLTQEELGKQLGVSNQAVSKWESEISMPDILLLPDIAKVLHVTLEDLYGISSAFNKDRISADEFPNYCHDRLIKLFYNSARIKFTGTDLGTSDREQLDNIINHIKRGNRLGCLSNTEGAIIITDDFSFIDCTYKAENSENIIYLQRTDNYALNYLTNRNFQKVLHYQYKETFQEDKVHGAEFSFEEIMNNCNLTEDETSAALRLLIDLGINEKCKDNTTKTTTYWFIISKALYVHAIYKLTELLIEDSCWTIVRDTSMINDYCFKDK